MSFGVIYIATGQKYIEEACNSAASLKKNLPNISITGFFDETIESVHFDKIVLIDQSNGKKNKVLYMSKSPYDYSLFIDTDTYICDDISELFSLLDKFDIAVAHAPYRQVIQISGIPESFPEYNTGVILFKKSTQISSFFENWKTLYEQQLQRETKFLNPFTQKVELLSRDQPSFREALYNSNLRVTTLTPEYNCRFIMPGYVDRTVKILHGRHPDLPLVAKTINAETKQRIYKIHSGSLEVILNQEKPRKWLASIHKLRRFIKKNFKSSKFTSATHNLF